MTTIQSQETRKVASCDPSFAANPISSKPPEQPDFSRRAHLSEWMDGPCSYSEFRDCLIDLEKLNRTTFAYRPIERWLEQFARSKSRPVHIVDVGCGGGDLLRRVEAWAAVNGLPVKLTGIDLNPFAARAAREFSGSESRIEWLTGNAFSYRPQTRIDLVLNSLFTHHLPDAEIVLFLAWMERVAAKGWFINDLHRQRLPYYGFRVLACIMRWHRFVRHDGALSFRRSFVHDDWRRYSADAGIEHGALRIYGVRPGRLCVSRVK